MHECLILRNVGCTNCKPYKSRRQKGISDGKYGCRNRWVGHKVAVVAPVRAVAGTWCGCNSGTRFARSGSATVAWWQHVKMLKCGVGATLGPAWHNWKGHNCLVIACRHIEMWFGFKVGLVERIPLCRVVGNIWGFTRGCAILEGRS
jgi:hypothetical protein